MSQPPLASSSTADRASSSELPLVVLLRDQVGLSADRIEALVAAGFRSLAELGALTREEQVESKLTLPEIARIRLVAQGTSVSIIIIIVISFVKSSLVLSMSSLHNHQI
eukprot:TRINITY_DN2856_c0_g1_i7.p2 TRINITY_DN2856_c0_g1~~TRINITY_DN2856_c0_g1_i7.p2  ORF type:complete len:121 (-),score=8.94 TRINITY_DN2856_c0_g1_i7:891-1217(-)